MPYSWDPISKRFRDPKGRYIPEKDILKILDVALETKDVVNLTRSYTSGQISKDVWHTGMRTAIKNAYLQAAMLAKGGRAQMTPADWGKAGGHTAEQYYHLDRKVNNFLSQIDDLTPAQAEARAKMYINSARQIYEEMRREEMVKSGAVFEKWVLGITEHCIGCLELARLGIVPIGTLWTVPGAGETPCLTSCHCRIAYYNAKKRRLSAKEDVLLLGSSKSGHYGHKGRKGQRGGSLAKGGLANTRVPLNLISDTVYVGMHADWYGGFEGAKRPAIKEAGILVGAKTQFTHEESRSDSVYVSNDAGLAAAYARLYHDPILLKVDVTKLDRTRFYYDPLDISDTANPVQMAYRGNIPPEAISVAGRGLSEPEYQEISSSQVISYLLTTNQPFTILLTDFGDVIIPGEYEETDSHMCVKHHHALSQHRRDHCMSCKKTPTKDVLWANGKGHAWFCNDCFEEWKAESDWHEVDKVKVIEYGVARNKWADKSPKELTELYADGMYQLGSAKSGFYGHKGRPGKRGGSAARGVSLVSTPKTIYHIPDEIQESATRYVEEQITKVAGKRGLTRERVEQRAQEQLDEWGMRGPVSVFVPAYVVGAIIEDGQLKNQHETNTSGAYLNPGLREDVEGKGFGISSGSAPEDYPIYGVISNKQTTGQFSYGNVELQLKDSVRDRTTVTVGDSLHNMNMGHVAPSPIANVSKASWDNRVDDLYAGGIANISYIEAQIHGGVSLSDIGRVVFHGDMAAIGGAAWVSVLGSLDIEVAFE